MRLHDFLDFHAREHPALEFAVQDGRRLDYAEARDGANRLANACVHAGLAVGDRVAILGKNSIPYVLSYFGASKAGAVPVPLNYRLAPPELVYIINDAQAKVLIAAAEYREMVDGIRGELGTVTRFVSIGGPARGWDDYDAWVNGESAAPPARTIRDGDDVYQMYTSGTTGRPKGAVLTHGAVTNNLVQGNLYLAGELGERWLIVAPLYHAAAAVTTFAAIYAGGSLYIMTDFNPAEVVRALSEERIARATLVPAMIQACLVGVPDVTIAFASSRTAPRRSRSRRSGAPSMCSSASSSRGTG
jgi:acyl-CoA synthetase (AMP-forming)/AMP-acid ligase II